MTGKTDRTDTRGVTPVVGIILLVAITVLLAASVGAFVMGMDDEATQQRVPTAAIDFDFDGGSSDNLTISHQSGQTIDADNLYVVIEGATCASGTAPNGEHDATSLGSPARFGSAAAMTIQAGQPPACSSGLDLESATVRVIWRGGTSSTTLRTWNS